jgi:hypothetical protein
MHPLMAISNWMVNQIYVMVTMGDYYKLFMSCKTIIFDVSSLLRQRFRQKLIWGGIKKEFFPSVNKPPDEF